MLEKIMKSINIKNYYHKHTVNGQIHRQADRQTKDSTHTETDEQTDMWTGQGVSKRG